VGDCVQGKGLGRVSRTAARSGTLVGGMPRILVVEDSFTTRSFVRSTIESEVDGIPGAEVVEAASGFDALRLLPRGPYDLVITDINMPDINGLELVQFMRKSEAHKNTPILLISTQSSEKDRQRGLRLGANGYLAKPFSPASLVQAALKHLGETEAVRENG
jgi:two-component system, chemotaxis family, chemotaxis protein CheY